MSWAEILGWLGSALFLARLVPQPVRLWRTGLTHGVSAHAVSNATVSDVGWLLYGVSVGLVPVWVCTALAIPLDIWTAFLLRRHLTVRTLTMAAGWGVIMSAAWLVAGGAGLGVVLGGSVLVNNAPQVWAAVRGDRLDGIASATWFIGIADAGLWGSYGVVVRDPALMAYGAILMTSSLVILTRLWQVGGSAALRPDFSHGLPDPTESI